MVSFGIFNAKVLVLQKKYFNICDKTEVSMLVNKRSFNNSRTLWVNCFRVSGIIKNFSVTGMYQKDSCMSYFKLLNTKGTCEN